MTENTEVFLTVKLVINHSKGSKEKLLPFFINETDYYFGDVDVGCEVLKVVDSEIIDATIKE